MAINQYSRQTHCLPLRCVATETKGRTLVATRAFGQGEVIIVEPPLHIVQEAPTMAEFKALVKLCKAKSFDYCPLWYWCALRSLTAEQLGGDPAWPALSPERQERLLLLHQGDIE